MPRFERPRPLPADCRRVETDRLPRPAWPDVVILAIFFVAGIGLALLVDREFLDHLADFRGGGNFLGHLPGWFEDLELPAKRIEFDFLAFLSLMTIGLAVATFRWPSSWRPGWFPAPGVAATASASLALVHQAVERLCLVYHNQPGDRTLELLWASRVNHWSPLDWGLGITLIQMEATATGAILGIWAYLLLARRWKAGLDWRDWLGRCVGWCWLLQPGFHVVATMLWG
jgi:hypothetical protein